MFSIFSQFIFGSSSLFGGQQGGSGSSTWKDKSLCFDLRQSDLELDHGEQLIACFFPIEDIKGNEDELGILKVTNLRLIWICCDKKRVNLSIGWRTVSLTFQQNLKDSLGSPVNSLCVLTKYESTKYEFVFNKVPAYSEAWNSQENFNSLIQLQRFYRNDKSLAITHLSPMYLDEPFEVVFKVWQSYKRTHLFRHCRANLTYLLATEPLALQTGIKVGEINKLPSEEIIDVYTGVIQSESRSVIYIGTLLLTNIRLVWLDESLPLRNLSIPYIRIDSIKLKQNNKILVNTHDYLATSNQIELRVQKTSDLQAKNTKLVFEQIQNLYTLYKSKPRFGPESCEENMNYMSHLRPIEHYLESLDDSIAKTLETIGPELNRVYLVDVDLNQPVSTKKASESRKTVKANDTGDANIERNENELNRYSLKLSNYLNEQPIERDRELIYSTELGLAVERPTNDVDLGRIWRIDL